MRKLPIIIFLLLAGGVALLMSASDEISSYGTFNDAKDSGRKVKVVGKLAKEKPIIYDPAIDPNYFSFFARDEEGTVSQVVALESKPRDFELSESVVMTVKYAEEDDLYIASNLLVKCPSKYKDEEVLMRSAKK